MGSLHATLSQPLAIVGASARAAAASAVRAGFQPLTADLFADADLRQISTATRISPYPEGLIDWLRAVEPPAWMYTGALENHPELVDQLAWIAPLWGNAGDALQRVRSPWELAAALRESGLLFPETRASDEGLPLDGSWLVKTCRGAGGSGVRALVERGRQGDKETRRNPMPGDAAHPPFLPVSLSPCLVFQRHIAGMPCAAVFVAAEGGAQLLGVARQLVGEAWLGAQGFQYAGSIGPLPLADHVLATIVLIGNVLAKQFELIGLFGVDMVVDGDRVWTIEVNPRYTASVEIVERTSGVCAVLEHADACCGGLGVGDWGPEEYKLASPQPPAPSPQFHGKAILFAKRNVIISSCFADQALTEASRSPCPSLADVPAAGSVIETGRPILTAFADGPTSDDVERQLRIRGAELERKLYSDGESV